MRSVLQRLGLVAVLLAAALPPLTQPAGAVTIVLGGLADGAAAFDDAALTRFGSVGSEIWTGLPETGVPSLRIFERTITRTSGSPVVARRFAIVGAPPDTLMSGQVVFLDPPETTDVATARFRSGVTIVSERPMRAIGFEVADWGSCCQPSHLYMALDGGAPIVVAETLTPGDVFLTSGGAALFVGLVGDGAPFSKVEFWHDGTVDFVAMGGSMHYSFAPDAPAPVPAPASLALLAAAIAVSAGSRARRFMARRFRRASRARAQGLRCPRLP